MIRYLKQKLEAHQLAAAQRRTARDLQFVYDSRKALDEREQFLHRYSAHLAVKEIDLSIAARRNARGIA